jgi:hypothetical protein
MTNATHPVPPALERMLTPTLALGVGALAVCGLGAMQSVEQFLRSYLFAFFFWVSVPIGALGLLMIQHLSGGRWGALLRRFFEAWSRTLPFALVLFLPVLLGYAKIYPWAHPAEGDRIVAHKALYLNGAFWIGRAVFYFALWSLFAWLFSKWSAEQDRDGLTPRLSSNYQALGGGGLVALVLSVSFASIDWGMSLNPHWFSTIYGVIYLVGAAMAVMALSIVLLARFAHDEPFLHVVRKDTIHDLGKLLFAFNMLWAYTNLSQFLIIWSGNLPEEIPFYLARVNGAWGALGLFVVLFHFVVPYAILLSRDVKRSLRLLAPVAGWLVLMRLVDTYWMIGPDLAGHHGAESAAFHPHWMDVLAPVGLGAIFVHLFLRQLKSRPLVPQHEAELEPEAAHAAPAHA